MTLIIVYKSDISQVIYGLHVFEIATLRKKQHNYFSTVGRVQFNTIEQALSLIFRISCKCNRNNLIRPSHLSMNFILNIYTTKGRDQ